MCILRWQGQRSIWSAFSHIRLFGLQWQWAGWDCWTNEKVPVLQRNRQKPIGGKDFMHCLRRERPCLLRRSVSVHSMQRERKIRRWTALQHLQGKGLQIILPKDTNHPNQKWSSCWRISSGIKKQTTKGWKVSPTASEKVSWSGRKRWIDFRQNANLSCLPKRK